MRSKHYLITAIVAISLFYLAFHKFYRSTSSNFHLIVPATNSNIDLCRLLLTLSVLRYPVPVLINWGGAEDVGHNGSMAHTVKVNTILQHLESRPPAQDDDLALILDGYDIWMQLPPELLLQRYYDVVDAANKRLSDRFNQSTLSTHNIRQTVVFGPDMICWPENYGRPACWAVPESILPPKAFGPETGRNIFLRRARWLNSGTVIGPVADLREMFKATLAKIAQNHTTDSDQFYFANVFGEQEYMRTIQGGGELDGPPDKEIPDVEPGQRTEFHIAIDYESALFQTVAWYKPFLEWLDFSQSVLARQQSKTSPIVEPISFDLPTDIASLASPYSALAHVESNPSISALPAWRDFRLGSNLVTKQVFPLLHFTGPKELRNKWWDKMWFSQNTEALLRAGVSSPKNPITTTPDGRTWRNGEFRTTTKDLLGEKGGAWSGRGEWQSWDSLCAPQEDELFGG